MDKVSFIETLSTKLPDLTLSPGRFIFTSDTRTLYMDTESSRICIGGLTIADNIVQPNWNETNTSSYAYIKNKPTIPTTMSGATSSAAGTGGTVPAPAAGKQSSFLRGDGTWEVPHDTTYEVATTSTNGLMSSSDKTKLNGISAGANNYSLPVASSSTRGGVKIGYTQSGKNYPVQLSNEQMYVYVPWTDTNTTYGVATSSNLGLVKSGTDITVDSSGNVSVNNNSHSHTVSNISDLTATATELNYVDGVTSSIQTQLNAKAPLASPAFSGTPTAPTQSAGNNSTRIATTAFVQTAVTNGIAASDAIIIKGTLGSGGTITAIPTTYKTGWAYRVITAGTYAGNVCEVGDLIVALVDRSGSSNANSDWTVLQTNINGAVTDVASGNKISVSRSGSIETVNHTTTSRSNSTTSQSPSFGGTFTAISAVSSDSYGHITGVTTKTVTMPSPGNATISITQNGTSVGSFTTNQSSGATIALTNVSGVKGNAESSYRTGQVNITPANIGALPLTGGTLTGNLTLKNSTNYGCKINLGDGDYVHLYEISDDTLEIKASHLNFLTSDTIKKNSVPLAKVEGTKLILTI